MLELIKQQLLKIIADIDCGNSNISNEEELISIAKALKSYTDKTQRLSKYKACQYLNCSRASFDNYVRAGLLPKGKKELGYKELSWDKKTLDEFIKNRRK